MKSAGKARNNGLYRHIRTSKEIIRNLLNDYNKDIIMTIHYRSQSPQILADFLSYHETIKAHSQRTVDEYYLDLRNFFRYIKQLRDPSLQGLPLTKSISWTLTLH